MTKAFYNKLAISSVNYPYTKYDRHFIFALVRPIFTSFGKGSSFCTNSMTFFIGKTPMRDHKPSVLVWYAQFFFFNGFWITCFIWKINLEILIILITHFMRSKSSFFIEPELKYMIRVELSVYSLLLLCKKYDDLLFFIVFALYFISSHFFSQSVSHKHTTIPRFFTNKL